MTYRDSMEALQRKVESLQADLDELRDHASSDTRAALERAYSLEVAVQDAKAEAQLLRLEKDQELAQVRQLAEIEVVHARESARVQAMQLDELRETHSLQVAALEEELAALRAERAELRARIAELEAE